MLINFVKLTFSNWQKRILDTNENLIFAIRNHRMHFATKIIETYFFAKSIFSDLLYVQRIKACFSY